MNTTTTDKKRNNEQDDCLVIKKNKVVNGDQGLGEILFFKVFRSKTIYKHIMSFMNVYRNDQPYQYIISIKQMLNNNQIELLKYKVKRNEHLSFNDNSLSPISTWLKLLSTIKDDKEFYICLFKYYKDYIPLRDCIDDKFERLTNVICETDCLIALQVLIGGEFNFKPTCLNLQSAFKYCRYEIIKLVQQSIGQPLNAIKSNEFFLYFPNLTPIKLLVKVVPALYKNKFTKSYYKFTFNQDTNSVEECIKCWKLFIELFKPTKQVLLDYFNKDSLVLFNNVNPLYFKLKELIQIISMLDILDIWELLDNLNFKYPQLWLRKDKLQLFEKRIVDLFIGETSISDQIKSCEFTNQQLNSNVNDSVNYYSSVNGQNEIIKKLLHVFYCITDGSLDNEYFSEYFICYGGIGIVNSINNIDQDEFNILNSFDHAHYPTFINWLKLKRNGFSTLSHSLNYSNQGIKPFSKCSNRELQIKFINALVNDIKSKSQYALPNWLFFIMLVNFDNVELVKYYADEIGSALVFNEASYSNTIINYIHSIEMMEFIFNRFYNWMDTPTHEMISMDTQKLDVLECFEQLYFKKISQMQNQLPKILHFNNGYKFSVTVSYAKHILKDLSLYDHYEVLLNYKPINFDELNYQEQELYFSLLKYAVQTTSFDQQPLKFNPLVFFRMLNFNYYPSKSMVKYLVWFLNSNYYQLSKRSIQEEWTLWRCNKSTILLDYFLIGNGEYDETNQLLGNISWSSIINVFDYTEIVRFSITRGDLITLDRILNILLSPLFNQQQPPLLNQIELKSIKAFILGKILKVVVFEEQILVLDHLYSNFNQLFVVGLIFTEKELTDFTISSLQSFNIKINNFLLNLYPISKEQYESISILSPHAYDYYKFKFNK